MRARARRGELVERELSSAAPASSAATLPVVERHLRVPIDLRGLVALAGDDDDRARVRELDALRGSPRAGPRSSGTSSRPRPPGRPRPRAGSPSGFSERGIVGGRDRDVGEAARDLAHRRPLAAVAVAAAAEDQDDLAVRQLAHRREQPLERVGRVRVVDEDRVRLPGLDALEAARHVRDAARARRRRRTSGTSEAESPAAAAPRRLATWNRPSSGEATAKRPSAVDDVEATCRARSQRIASARKSALSARTARSSRRGGGISASSRRPYGSSTLTTAERAGLAQVEEAASWPRSTPPCRRGSRGGRASGS